MAVQELLEGAAQAVRGVLGEGTAIYLGREEQGVKRPCVFLEAEMGGRRPLPFGREELTVTVTAAYLSRDKEELREALERLTRALSVVELPDETPLRGTQLAGENGLEQTKVSARYAVVLSQSDGASEPMGSVLQVFALGQTESARTGPRGG